MIQNMIVESGDVSDHHPDQDILQGICDCYQDDGENYKRVLMKFAGWVGHGEKELFKTCSESPSGYRVVFIFRWRCDGEIRAYDI